jgi:hypothetical protein
MINILEYFLPIGLFGPKYKAEIHKRMLLLTEEEEKMKDSCGKGSQN